MRLSFVTLPPGVPGYYERSVSYTHLDVYKRQALGYVNPYAAVKRHCRGPLTKREGVVQKVHQSGISILTVSYTHLDVYKRQHFDSVEK